MKNQQQFSHKTKPHTNFLVDSYQMDTDIRDFTEADIQQPRLPSKRRSIRLHIPQLVDPLVLVDVTHLIVGRDSGNQRLDLSRQYGAMLGVSRDHAAIDFVDGTYTITDLGSTNGTFLNGHRLEPHQPQRIEDNDQIRFGHFVTIINFT